MTKRLLWLLICAIGVFALGFVYRKGVDINYDLRNYHYFAGYSLIHWRFGKDIAPSGVQSFLNPIYCALVYLLITSQRFPANAFVIAILQLSSLPILILIVTLIDGELENRSPSVEALLALCLCLAAPLWWAELGTTFFSSTTSPLVLLGLLFGMQGVSRVSRSALEDSRFIFAGAVLGFACGLKLTNSVFAIALLLALAIVLLRIEISAAARHLFTYVLGLAAGFAPTAWWNVFLYRRWGSPLFPFYNSIFRSPYFPPVNFTDARFQFHSFFEFAHFLFAATTGTKATADLEFADARMLLVAVLMCAALTVGVLKRFGPRRALSRAPMKVVIQTFIYFFSASFALWAYIFAYQRYLIPVELLFGIATWILAAYLLKNRVHLTILMSACLLVSLATIEVSDYGHVKYERGEPNILEIKASGDLALPADYLLYGQPLTFALVSLHPESRFFRMGFSFGADKLIASALESDRSRPIRLLTVENRLAEASAELAHFGMARGAVCWHLGYGIVAYEVQSRAQPK